MCIRLPLCRLAEHGAAKGGCAHLLVCKGRSLRPHPGSNTRQAPRTALSNIATLTQSTSLTGSCISACSAMVMAMAMGAVLSAGFYANQTGDAIVAALQQRGGVLTAEDLAAHRTAFVEPISTTYRGHRVYEVPPPTQVGESQLSECDGKVCQALSKHRVLREPRLTLCSVDTISSSQRCPEELYAASARILAHVQGQHGCRAL
jgi:Gamma-glutamyltranspeptidase